MNNLTYPIVALLLVLLELLYFGLAERLKIIDRPNERSSHKHPTIRGGGIIFIVAGLLFSVWNGLAYPYLMMALVLSGGVSFVDDIRSLPNWIRFLAHLCSCLLLFIELDLFTLPWLWLPLMLVFVIGVINAYNFMDGINGITGLYSLAIIVPLLLTEQNLLTRELELFTLIGLLVFLFFNARKRARCFAGDVGSVSMAVIVIFLLAGRMYQESNLIYLGFLLLYGVDTILTIIQRLYLRENIFKAHRRHLFQLYSNEYKAPHLLVSAGYGLVQLLINWLILENRNTAGLLPILIVSASAVYIVLKWLAYRGIRKGKTD